MLHVPSFLSKPRHAFDGSLFSTFHAMQHDKHASINLLSSSPDKIPDLPKPNLTPNRKQFIVQAKGKVNFPQSVGTKRSKLSFFSPPNKKKRRTTIGLEEFRPKNEFITDFPKPKPEPIELDEIITSDEEDTSWCPSPPCSGQLQAFHSRKNLTRYPKSLGPLSPSPMGLIQDDIISSDEEDGSLFSTPARPSLPTPRIIDPIEDPILPPDDIKPILNTIDIETKHVVSPKRNRWLDSIATPEKDTQGDSFASFARKRKGPRVARLHKLMETKKIEETAAKHILATRALQNIPDSNTRVVIKAGRVVGTLYKTRCISLDSEGLNTKEVRVMFTTEKKMEHSLQPGVMMSLIPPWQEFTFEEDLPFLFCSTFQIISKESALSPDPELCKNFHSTPSAKRPIFSSSPSPLLPLPLSPFPSKIEHDPMDITHGNTETNYPATGMPESGGSVEKSARCLEMNEENQCSGLLFRFICQKPLEDFEGKEKASLVDWFDGFSIVEEENFPRVVSSHPPLLFIRQSPLLLLVIELPSFLCKVSTIAHLFALEGKEIHISSISFYGASILSSEKTSTLLSGFLTGEAKECKVVFAQLTKRSSISLADENEHVLHSIAVKTQGSQEFEKNVLTIHQLFSRTTHAQRITICGKLIPFIRDSGPFSRSQNEEYAFLFDSSSSLYTHVAIRISDRGFMQALERVVADHPIVLLRDVFVHFSPISGVRFHCDQFTSVFQLKSDADMEEEGSESFHLFPSHTCDKVMYSALEQCVPSFAMLDDMLAIENGMVAPQSIVLVNGSVISCHVEESVALCDQCGKKATCSSLHKYLKNILFCSFCSAVVPCAPKWSASLAVSLLDGRRVEIEVPTYQCSNFLAAMELQDSLSASGLRIGLENASLARLPCIWLDNDKLSFFSPSL